jgi:hypothetical protein
MVKGSAIFLGELLAFVLTWTLIGGVILKVSCILYNLLAAASSMSSEPMGSPTPESEPDTRTNRQSPSVPKPSIEWAMCIVFVAVLVNMLAGFIVNRVLHLAGLATGLNALRSIPIDFVFFLLGTLIHGGINAAMLPTSFRKGLMIALIQVFLSALIIAVLVIVLVLIALVFALDFSQFG